MLNQDEIKERLEKIKSDIENAFEKELIDFDELQSYGHSATPEDKIVLNIGYYI